MPHKLDIFPRGDGIVWICYTIALLS